MTVTKGRLTNDTKLPVPFVRKVDFVHGTKRGSVQWNKLPFVCRKTPPCISMVSLLLVPCIGIRSGTGLDVGRDRVPFILPHSTSSMQRQRANLLLLSKVIVDEHPCSCSSSVSRPALSCRIRSFLFPTVIRSLSPPRHLLLLLHSHSHSIGRLYEWHGIWMVDGGWIEHWPAPPSLSLSHTREDVKCWCVRR